MRFPESVLWFNCKSRSLSTTKPQPSTTATLHEELSEALGRTTNSSAAATKSAAADSTTKKRRDFIPLWERDRAQRQQAFVNFLATFSILVLSAQSFNVSKQRDQYKDDLEIAEKNSLGRSTLLQSLFTPDMIHSLAERLAEESDPKAMDPKLSSNQSNGKFRFWSNRSSDQYDHDGSTNRLKKMAFAKILQDEYSKIIQDNTFLSEEDKQIYQITLSVQKGDFRETLENSNGVAEDVVMTESLEIARGELPPDTTPSGGKKMKQVVFTM